MKRALFLVPFVAVALLWGQDLPEGDGKKLVEEVCSGCHGLDVVTSQRGGKDEWEQIIDSMVQRGAVAKDEEVAKMVEYLAKNFPKSKK